MDTDWTSFTNITEAFRLMFQDGDSHPPSPHLRHIVAFVGYHEDLLYTDLAQFNLKLADWLAFYNGERPHHRL